MEHLQIAHATDKGPRDNLEDAIAAFEFQLHAPIHTECTVLAVCDGVGGNAHGEVASAIAIDCLMAGLPLALAKAASENGSPPLPKPAVAGALESMFQQANEAILGAVAAQPQLKGMSTTAVSAVVASERLHVAWAGDSRCYLHRHGMLQRLTRDHSDIQRLIADGVIDREQAKDHPLAHSIYQFMGKADGFEPDTHTRRLWPGDVLLLCSDGLTDVISDKAIASMIDVCSRGRVPFEDLPSLMLRQALAAGTTDNVTVLCAAYQPGAKHTAIPERQTRTASYSRDLARSLYPSSLEGV